MNLLKALVTVGGMTFISRLLGFARDTLIARIFGAGMATDAFFVAFKIPNLLRRISGEGAFSQAFVPILSEYRKQRTPEATKALINHVASLLGLFLVAITIVGMLAAPLIVQLTSPGFASNPAKFALTTELLRITFPYILFISLVSMAGGVLNAYSKFQVPAFTPVWLNLSFIVAALFVAPHFNYSVYVLAWAVFVGGVIQLLYQLPYLQKIGMLPRYAWNTQDEGVRRILKLMGPAIFGVSVAQISIVLNNVFASFMPTGSVSWLYYADRLMEFPTGVLGVALGTILLPSLSKAHVDQSAAEFSQLLDWGLRLTFMLAIPAAVAMAVLSRPLVASLFYYGKFTPADVVQTEHALIAYSLSLLGLIMVKVLAPGFYARQNVKTPVKIAIFTLVITQCLNVLFLYFTPLRHAGLALAVGLGACLNATLLWVTLQRTGGFHPNKGWMLFLARLLLAVTVMGITLHLVAAWAGDWLAMPALPRLMHLAGVVILGMAVYFAMLAVLGFRPKDFIKRVAK